MKPRVKLRGTADYGELKLTSVPSDGNKRRCEERLCIWLPGIHVDVLTPLAASRTTPAQILWSTGYLRDLNHIMVSLANRYWPVNYSF